MPLDDRLDQLALDLQERSTVEVDVEAALAATRSRSAPRSSRRGLLTAVAAVVLAAVIGAAVVRTMSAGSHGEQVRTGTSTEHAPPPVDRTKPYLWLGASHVPPSGGDLPVVLVGPRGTQEIFSVAVELEHWNGAAWTQATHGSVCLDGWLCTGEIGVEEIRLIGLSADGMGALTWLGLDRLAPGWYRLSTKSNEGLEAAGQFEVSTDAPALPPADHLVPHLGVSPAVRLGTMSSTTAAVTLVSDDAPSFDGWPDGTVNVEAWDGTTWVATGSRPLEQLRRVDGGLGDQWIVDVGVRSPGTYRLTVTSGTRTLSGRFWMVENDDLSARPDNAGAPSPSSTGPTAGPTTTALAQDGSCTGSSFPALAGVVPGDTISAQSASGTTTVRVRVPSDDPALPADRSWITIELAPPFGPFPSIGDEVREVEVMTATSKHTAALSTRTVVDPEGDGSHVLRQLVWDDGGARVIVQALNVELDRIADRLRSLEVVDRGGFIEFLAAHGLTDVCTS